MRRRRREATRTRGDGASQERLGLEQGRSLPTDAQTRREGRRVGARVALEMHRRGGIRVIAASREIPRHRRDPTRRRRHYHQNIRKGVEESASAGLAGGRH